MKLVSGRPLGEPAPPKLLELANAVEPVQDGRIYIELIDPSLGQHCWLDQYRRR